MITVPEKPSADLSSGEDLFLCPDCDGTGELVHQPYGVSSPFDTSHECTTCQGRGALRYVDRLALDSPIEFEVSPG